MTLGALLQGAGYETACIGKWHLGWDWAAIYKGGKMEKKKVWEAEDFDWSKAIPGGPLDHGFDSYFGDNVINFPPYCWIENDQVAQVPDETFRPENLKAKTKEGNCELRPGPGVKGWDFYKILPTLAERGAKYLEDRKGREKPFFLYFAFPSPHAPIIPNDEFDGKSGAGAYGDFVVQTDAIVGELVAALKKAGKYEDTVIIFSSDNGPERYAYERWEKHGHWSAEPFRGLKRDVYEGGHHVPFVVKWSGVTKAGSVSDALVSQTDIFATVAEYLGEKIPSGVAADSVSFLPVLRGEEPARKEMVHNTYEGVYALRQGDWLYLDAPNGFHNENAHQAFEKSRNYPVEDDYKVELYNLADDPGQKTNLARSRPERTDEMKKDLEEVKRGD